jgi:hypothetical protein
MKKSLKWHSEWFYVKNHAEALRDALPKFTGRLPQDSGKLKAGVTTEEMKTVEVLVDMVRELKRQGLTDTGLCSTFFEMRVQPLKVCSHFMWLYSDKTDPIRESAEELTMSEVAVWLTTMLEMKQEEAKTMFVGHPTPRTLKTDFPNVSLLPTLCLCYNLD